MYSRVRSGNGLQRHRGLSAVEMMPPEMTYDQLVAFGRQQQASGQQYVAGTPDTLMAFLEARHYLIAAIIANEEDRLAGRDPQLSEQIRWSDGSAVTADNFDVRLLPPDSPDAARADFQAFVRIDAEGLRRSVREGVESAATVAPLLERVEMIPDALIEPPPTGGGFPVDANGGDSVVLQPVPSMTLAIPGVVTLPKSGQPPTGGPLIRTAGPDASVEPIVTMAQASSSPWLWVAAGIAAFMAFSDSRKKPGRRRPARRRR